MNTDYIDARTHPITSGICFAVTATSAPPECSLSSYLSIYLSILCISIHLSISTYTNT